MTRLLIDADIIPYEIGFVMEKDEIADWEQIKKAVDNRIDMIIAGAKQHTEEGIDELTLVLSDPDGTFRQKVATIQPYKGNRKKDKPVHWDGIRAYLRERYGAEHMPLLEGDDALMILLSRFPKTIVASSDKDLKQVPICMYSWPVGENRKEKYEEVLTPQCFRYFWTQMLVGDRVDNILGLFSIGPTSACVKKLALMKTETEMANMVFDEYHRRFGSYARTFFVETYQLLKLVGEGYDPESLDPETWQLNELRKVWGLGNDIRG